MAALSFAPRVTRVEQCAALAAAPQFGALGEEMRVSGAARGVLGLERGIQPSRPVAGVVGTLLEPALVVGRRRHGSTREPEGGTGL
jgi:hypothetical protein